MSTAASQGQSELDMNIERFKLKKLIKTLELARGSGTSVITLLVPPKTQISQCTQMLNGELGACANIKSHTNKLSVQTAITATLGRLKMFNKVPPNGMILFCGTVLTEDDKEKKVTIDIEPFKAVSRSLYMCDNKFHTDELRRMLESDDKFGFIIIDGTGAMFATVTGSVKEKLGSISVELPKKHGRGGQSKNRFARIRQEKRHHYVRKVSELATQYFIMNGERPNVAGLVLAGSAEFKEVLSQSDLLDPRLRAIIMKVVDIAHPGDIGLNQAIELSADTLSGVKLVSEKKLLAKFMDEIAMDTELFCFGIVDTMKCVEMGAVQTLICWEDLEINRYVITPSDESAPTIVYMTEAEWSKTGAKQAQPKQTGEGSVVTYTVEHENFVDWMAVSYNKLGVALELVSNRSSEGSQFVRGFGGVGGLLRYKVNLVQLRQMEEEAEEHEKNKKLKTVEELEEEDDFWF